MKWASEQALDGVTAVALAQATTPLATSDRARLTEFYERLIAEAGAELPPMREVPPPSAARHARRLARQRADRLVRVLTTVRRAADVDDSTEVAA